MRNEKEDKVNQICNELWTLAYSSLLIKMRFLHPALNKFRFIQYSETLCIDGETIMYNPKYVIKKYYYERNFFTHAFLHLTLHCIFFHPFVTDKIEYRLWDLACDIAVAAVIHDIDSKDLYIAESKNQIEYLENIKRNVKSYTADNIYRFLKEVNYIESQLELLEEIFKIDSHSNWYNGGPDFSNEGDESGQNKNLENSNVNTPIMTNNSLQLLKDSWERINAQIKNEIEFFSKDIGTEFNSLIQNVHAIRREKYSYESFLKKFAVMTEVLKVDMDEFDYIFYTYGLNIYKNIPLIEYLEYKDEKRISDFVIVIDTSGSCSGETVQRFLNKTCNILLENNSFNHKVNIHLIQCDNRIQSDVKITSLSEVEFIIKNLKLFGFGGTDFRPAFDYIDQLIKQEKLNKLKGIIYFTDGFGIFPEKPPKYKTTFIFFDDLFYNDHIPSWAIPFYLSSDEMKV